MARNSGVLARQLLGNRNKLCAALLNHHHKLPSNSFHTLASISTTPFSSHTTPSNSKPFSKSVHHFSNLHFLQHRPLSSPSGPSNIVPIRSENEYHSAINMVQDKASPALFYFTAVWCGPCRFISPVIGELSEQYPHVTTYKIDIDEEGLANTLGKLNISSVPTFQFFQDGKVVAEIIGADVARLRDTFGKLYKQE
ncbi:thioredoxin O2 mitochondrial [Prunus yedoensis var. nudiflora]|uniref:Thioredoxin O2 mitochondrial n=1 Tax=Prunus yedoensis var. nudiflora TaxID=2094558 RepID=A0A314ZNU9_PRUYE|nr:thioredoxin O2 mitochondrial [Prunus yedoensis var. nudiflora]